MLVFIKNGNSKPGPILQIFNGCNLQLWAKYAVENTAYDTQASVRANFATAVSHACKMFIRLPFETKVINIL